MNYFLSMWFVLISSVICACENKHFSYDPLMLQLGGKESAHVFFNLSLLWSCLKVAAPLHGKASQRAVIDKPKKVGKWKTDRRPSWGSGVSSGNPTRRSSLASLPDELCLIPISMYRASSAPIAIPGAGTSKRSASLKKSPRQRRANTPCAIAQGYHEFSPANKDSDSALHLRRLSEGQLSFSQKETFILEVERRDNNQ